MGKRTLAWFLVLMMLATCGVSAFAEDANGFAAQQESLFAEPAMEFWPETRWWLAEGSHTDTTIEEAVQEAYDSRLGAVEFATLEENVDKGLYAWGSDEWVNDSHKVIEAATALGMGASFTSGTHWRTANIPGLDPNSDAASQELAVTVQDVASGETFDGEILAPECADGITSQKLVAVVAARKASASEESVTHVSDSITEITDTATATDDGCTLSFTAEDGDYALFAYFQRGTAQLSEPSVDINYSINYFDIAGFNAFKDYWDKNIFTDEMLQLIKENGKVQLFMDSLELAKAGGFIYWSSDFRDEFIERKGYDLTPYLMLLISGPRGSTADPYQLDGEEVPAQKYTNDYKDVITQLYIEYLMEPLAEYLHANGVELRAQIAYGQTLEASLPIGTLDYVESESLNANDQPEVYRYQAGAQHLYGINKFSSETGATWVNYSWSLQHILQNPVYTGYLGGVNRIIYHGYASIWGPEESTTWPGHEGMYGGISERMDIRQPFYQDLKAMNTHLARIQEALRYGQPQTDVGILNLDYNMRTAYGQPISHLLEHQGYYWQDVSMQDAGYAYDYFNPQILTQEGIEAANGVVAPDGPSYQALIVHQESLPADVAEKLIEYAENGVAILVLDGAAQHTPWNDGQDEALAAAMEKLTAMENVRVLANESEAVTALAELGVQPRAMFAEPNQVLMTVMRADKDAAYLFVNNYTQPTETTGAENENLAEGDLYIRHYDDSTAVSIDTTISVDGSYIPYTIDPWTGAVARIADYSIADGRTIFPVSLDHGDSALYVFEPVEADTLLTITETNADEALTDKDGKLAIRAFTSGSYTTTLSDGSSVDTELTVNEPLSLKSWHLSVEDWQQGEMLTRTEEKDGYTTTEVTYDTTKDLIDVDIDELKTWNDIEGIGYDVSGVGTYTTTFTLPEGFTDENGAYLDLGEQASSTKVTINGVDAADVNLNRPRVDVSDLLKDGENTIEIRLSTNLTNRLLAMGKINPGIANLGMDFPRYITGYHNYGLTSVELIPYAQAEVE